MNTSPLKLDPNTQPPVPANHSEASIDAPSLTEQGALDLEGLSVKSAEHALEICKASEVANRHRSIRTAQIQSAYDGATPVSLSALQAHAQSWMSNFSTQWLAGLVDPAVLRAIEAVTASPLLTKSALPRNIPDWKSKSDTFQSIATRMFRSWSGFSPLVANLAQENVLHGYTFAVWLDPQTWKPTFYKQETAYVPEEASQIADELQFFSAKQDYLLHEFLDLFTDEGAAEQAGYHLENCTEAANRASVKNPKEDASVTEFRRFSDMIADGTLGLTYTRTGPRVVKVWLLWTREYDGQVSFWLLERDSGKLLRYVKKAYKNMPSAVTLFALQPGNGHLHNSKGVGRKLIATALAVERGRNGALDAARMSALLLLKVDSKDRKKLQTSITAPFAVFDKSIDIEPHRFQANADEFLKLDQMLSAWAQQASGSYISALIDPNGSRRTATEASLDASREQEHGDQVRARWVEQFSRMLTQMQVRAFSDENIKAAQKEFEAQVMGEEPSLDLDPEVTALLEMLTAGLTESEIKYLRAAPASGIIAVEEAYMSKGIANIAAMYSGDPRIDQQELLRRNVEAMAGPEVARTLVIPNIDQTIEAEATQKQLEEAATMTVLEVPVPVSPRDNHVVHAKTLMSLLASLFPALSQDLAPGQKLMKSFELGLNHLGEHLQAAAKAGLSDTPQFKEVADWHKKTVGDFKKVIQIQAQAQQAQQVPPSPGGEVAADMPPQGMPPPTEAPQRVAPGAPAGVLPEEEPAI